MMNKFNKEDLRKEGQYLLWGPERKFVARFKYSGPFTMSKFRKELIANHTPESYFEAYNAGKAPLEILRDKNPVWYRDTLEAFKNRF
jgi:hypothetical protein